MYLMSVLSLTGMLTGTLNTLKENKFKCIVLHSGQYHNIVHMSHCKMSRDQG